MLAGVYSCEEDEGVNPKDETEQEGTDDQNSDDQEEKTYLVMEKSYTTQFGSESRTYTYDENDRVDEFVYFYSGSTTTYELDYDSEGRVTSISKNGEVDEKFSYSGNTVTKKSSYKDTWTTVNITLNDDGKIIRKQTEGSDTYYTYEWENGNMISETRHSDGETDITTYSYDETILNPAFDKYLENHPMHESKNALTLKQYSGDSKAEYTLESNDAGYLTEIQGGMLNSTTTYTYNVE